MQYYKCRLGKMLSQQRSEEEAVKMHVCIQAVMGQLLKGHLAHRWGIDPASIYHCAVMPCYDKKLEASREDFNLPGVYPAHQALLHRPVSCSTAETLMQMQVSERLGTPPHR